MSTKPLPQTTENSTKQNFKRLLAYAKAYKAAAVVSILGMLGYAAIDSSNHSLIKVLMAKTHSL